MANNHSEEEEESGEDMEVSSPGNADSESESDSESEPEQEQPSKKPPVAAPKKPQPQDSSSSTEEETDSESEPDLGTQKPNPAVKPIASKPMDEPNKAAAAKPRSKANTTAKPASPKKSTAVAGAKRPVDDGEAKESKRSKKKPEKEIENPVKKIPTEDVKRQLFQRLWSEDDEIVILKGMTDYRSKKKADPVADLSAFHEFIKKSLHVDVTKTQLQDKIRRLKKKYENNAGKEKKGKERTFSKPHEQKAYDLSKKIWGKEKTDKSEVEVVKVENATARKGQSNSGNKDNGDLVEVKEEKQSAEVEKTEEVPHNLSLISCAKNVAALEKWLEENSGSLSTEKRNEMKKKFAPLNVAAVDLSFRRVKLINEQWDLVREAMKASGIDI